MTSIEINIYHDAATNLLKSPSYGLSLNADFKMADRTILEHLLLSVFKLFILRYKPLIETKLQFKIRFCSYNFPKKDKENIATSNSNKN